LGIGSVQLHKLTAVPHS